MSDEVKKLVDGFHKFRTKYFVKDTELYEHLNTEGQSPKTLVVGCSDSRVDPALLMQAKPGDIFVIRNVANLVPPYEKGGGFHGVSSAIEFAVNGLKVESIIVLGHEQCGGINALLTGDYNNHSDSFISSWMKIAIEAKYEVLREMPSAPLKDQLNSCAKKSVLISMENLMSFPFIQARMKDQTLKIYGWFFELDGGRMLEFDYEQRKFVEI
ncbi:carbonic anhydrase [Bdellovibrio svalbardensis]|uniref:Carbonic anhydrase n=1 Tax=Bdellovibrio svalbardensis TaxID=2972972 RepID=A0ABT6DI90_9BACT|nr:carbonic anhydrase [Bdellovibrio svalbardensis]MDG0816552.1 carbonic anhydrase [Bdellovibrio svalbardensis]